MPAHKSFRPNVLIVEELDILHNVKTERKTVRLGTRFVLLVPEKDTSEGSAEIKQSHL